MFRWYVINTYSGHENKVKTNLEHRIVSMNQQPRFRRVVVPTEQVVETKDGQKVQTEKRVLPGYVLVNMDMSEVDRILHTATAAAERPRTAVEFALGETVKITQGSLSDFDGEVIDVNADQQKLKVLVNIFERQTPVEVSFDQVKKMD